jgi:hypothetical protein
MNVIAVTTRVELEDVHIGKALHSTPKTFEKPHNPTPNALSIRKFGLCCESQRDKTPNPLMLTESAHLDLGPLLRLTLAPHQVRWLRIALFG